MKNHFFFRYEGNKRNECDNIYKSLNFTNIDTIIEPFCGSCAISYYIWLKHPNINFKLNDNNKFIKDLYDICQDDNKIKEFEEEYKKKVLYFSNFDEDFNIRKQKYNETLKDRNDLLNIYIGCKIYCIHPFLYPIDKRNYKTNINIKETPIYNFFKNGNIEFTCDDAINIYNKYKNNNKNIIILDPPYISLSNDFYINSDMNIYEYLYNNSIKNEKAKIYLILNDIWINRLLFRNCNFLSIYEKKYEVSKKKVNHIIIYNK